MERNRRHHGTHYADETGEFHVVTQEWRSSVPPEEPDADGTVSADYADVTSDWEPEIEVYLHEQRQLTMIRVITPDGRDWRLDLT